MGVAVASKHLLGLWSHGKRVCNGHREGNTKSKEPSVGFALMIRLFSLMIRLFTLMIRLFTLMIRLFHTDTKFLHF